MTRYVLVLAMVMGLVGGCKKGPGKPTATTPETSEAATTSDAVASGKAVSADVNAPPAGLEASGPLDVLPQEVEADGMGLSELPPLAAISWSMTPDRLDVMRDTEVTFSARWEGAPADRFTCLWDPGDRTGTLRGCDQTHRFANGLVDRQVTLEIVVAGRPVFSESRSLLLEKLPVQELSGDGDQALPKAPDGGHRVLLWAAFAPPTQGDLTALKQALTDTGARSAVLFFNSSVDGAATASLLAELHKESGVALMPVFCGAVQGAEALERLPEAFVPHGKGNQLPFRHGAMVGGVGLVVLDSRVRGNSMEHEKWMLEQLEGLRVASHRLVLSCRPLETFTGDGDELTPQFRYYEKLLRGDISALISSGNPVYYDGSYGDLTTISAGCAAGSPGTISGTDAPQKKLYVLLDLARRKAATAYGIPVANPGEILDLTGLPRQVGNYLRRN